MGASCRHARCWAADSEIGAEENLSERPLPALQGQLPAAVHREHPAQLRGPALRTPAQKVEADLLLCLEYRELKATAGGCPWATKRALSSIGSYEGWI